MSIFLGYEGYGIFGSELGGGGGGGDGGVFVSPFFSPDDVSFGDASGDAGVPLPSVDDSGMTDFSPPAPGFDQTFSQPAPAMDQGNGSTGFDTFWDPSGGATDPTSEPPPPTDSTNADWLNQSFVPEPTLQPPPYYDPYTGAPLTTPPPPFPSFTDPSTLNVLDSGTTDPINITTTDSGPITSGVATQSGETESVLSGSDPNYIGPGTVFAPNMAPSLAPIG